MFNNKLVTAGEHLCRHLYNGMVAQEFWDNAQYSHLTITRRPGEFRLFIQEALALNMAGRLLVAAESAAKQVDAEQPGFLAYLEAIVISWDLERLDTDGRLCRLIRDAHSAKCNISKTLHKQLENWAVKHHPLCYLCGVPLDFDSNSQHNRFTLDHIWPENYGGDSISDNLLPCCDACNSGKKCDFATWAACDVHSFMISKDPSANEMSTISGRMRFALHNRAVRTYANKRNCSLKEAYLRIGPWLDEPWPLSEDDAGDFFNLANYEPNRCQPYGNQLLRLS